MKKHILFLLIIFSNSYFFYAQPNIEWQKCLGGTSDDFAYSIQQTTDGGYIVAGTTQSNDSDVTGNHGSRDYWIVKLDNSGGIQWQKCLGGSNGEGIVSIQQNSDGGYIVSGLSISNDGDVTGNHGGSDFWIIKLDSAGGIQWQKCLGGSDVEVANSIQQTTDGGFIVAGNSLSNDGDVTGNHGDYDYWIVKLDSTGVIQWQKSLGGTGDDRAYFIQQTSDGGYIVAGRSISNDCDVTGNHGYYDYWIVKLDSTGDIHWQKCFGGSDSEIPKSIQQTSDGGYIIAGYSGSNDGDVTGNHFFLDYWIVKLNSIGVIQWQKSLGGTGFDDSNSIQQTSDGGYIVAGFSNSINGDVTGKHGNFDYWIVKLDSSVNVAVTEFQKPSFNLLISPNPFLTLTTFSFQLSFPNKPTIEIRSIEGRLIKKLVSDNFKIGLNEIIWDATNNLGSKVKSGIYFITIISDNFSETKKVILLRN